MKHQWVAYVIVAILSIGAGVAIAGLPDSVPQSETIIPPTTTTEAPAPTIATTTTSVTTTTEAPVDTEPADTDPDDTEPDDTEPDDTEPDDATTTTDEPDETTTTIEAIEPRSAVAVAVANGSGRNGVAGATADELIGLGYTEVAALTGNDVVDRTIVFFADGNDGVAERMAADLGLAPDAIALITGAPVVQDLGIVQLLVYIGTDRV
jgi:hypothetical protein